MRKLERESTRLEKELDKARLIISDRRIVAVAAPLGSSYGSAGAGKSALRDSWSGSPAGRRREIEGSAELTAGRPR